MADEMKYRQEKKDRPSLPTFAKVMLVMSVIQVVLTLSFHGIETAHMLMLVILGTAAIVLTALTAYLWGDSPTFRKVIRTVVIAIPTMILAFGAVLAIATQTEVSDALFNFLASMTLAVVNCQLVAVFMLPVLTTAASFGGKFDRVLLCVTAVFNALTLPFFVFYSSTEIGSPLFTVEETVLQLVYILYGIVFAALTFVPALGNDPDHRLPELKANGK